MLTKRDWTLLALAAAGGATLSPVQLQKVLFLFGQNAPDAVAGSFYRFIPYNYGPFDASIYSDAEALAAEGLVSIGQRPGRKWADYAATPQAAKEAARLKQGVPAPAIEYLALLVAWVRRVSFEDLLRIVYEKYPDYAINSVFRG